ncbi:MAG: sulfate adenylyltransferase [Phycisphaerales bacterium]|nr:MAG: sulfate adenylyltransferase [Phycisphaerales bacterium]
MKGSVMGQVELIQPHGGKLVDRTGAKPDAKAPAVSITLTERQQCDWEMIAIGAMSPLEGFMGEADYHSACDNMTLTDGTIWPMPITCAVDDATADKVSVGDRVACNDDAGRLLGYITVDEKYKQDKKKQAAKAFGTEDEAHPGVKVLYDEGDTCLAGKIDVVTTRHAPMFSDHRFNPCQLREEFKSRGWHTVVAFQTRNPIHRAHEYLTKCAQEITDGLLIHPLMGATKDGDIPPEVRMQCYEVLIENYYHPDHTMLSVMPAAMRYAGPREAILHCILRQNYGCSHFIVGRDHAGVGDYYGTYDAQKIFETLPEGALKITTLNFEHSAWSKKAGGMVSGKTFPKIEGDQIFLSGTKVREMLRNGERPPVEFTRPEVAEILIESMKES